MATKITMPQLGESVTEGTITKWLVQPGDKVKKYDPLAEVMTDKVNAEIPSSYEGTIVELLAEEDETLEVGSVICTMDIAGETSEDQEKSVVAESTNEKTEEETSVQENSQRKRYSPAVLRLSQEHDIDLDQVDGSGKGGRITRKDLMKVIESGDIPPSIPAEKKEMPSSEEETTSPSRLETEHVETPVANGGRTIEIPISGVRRAIANKMVKSKQEAPHAWMMVEVDVTNLVNLRNKKKDEFLTKEGLKLTFLPFFIKATVDGLKKYPQVNSMWAGDKIIQNQDVHLSIAVATEEELFVPVIKHADEKNIKGLAREIDSLARKVRSNTLKQEDMSGGTFTVNNTGTFGSIQSQPIINHPQAAIMTVESIVKKPVVLENDAIAIRHMVNLCLSLDHRVLDGLVCGNFLKQIKENLENMNEDSTTIY